MVFDCDIERGLAVSVPIPKKLCGIIAVLSVILLLLAAAILLPVGIYMIKFPCFIPKLFGFCFLIVGGYAAVTVLRVLPTFTPKGN